jgi:hypothetical protein
MLSLLDEAAHRGYVTIRNLMPVKQLVFIEWFQTGKTRMVPISGYSVTSINPNLRKTKSGMDKSLRLSEPSIQCRLLF